MFKFCPYCTNLLTIKYLNNYNKLTCPTCPYLWNITEPITKTFYPKLKSLDDILGGDEAWKNVQTTDEKCPKCNHPKAYFKELQIRSADEPMTLFFKCENSSCNHRWNV